jgi:para-nitrobenzyl esterase
MRIHQGGLRGRREDGVTAYLGVPYAAPPVGPARFRPPEPPPSWRGVRDATRVGPAAPQPPSRLAAVMGNRVVEQDEDCLTLNVWTPEGPQRPVLVFLHGGGFLSGSGGLDWYDGAELARRGGIVVVTVNYRLGALGFLSLDEANLGVRDQIQALRWVRDTIDAFGGDPAAVTVAGQSAGAISILAMLSGTAADGLFHRAVLQSTPAGMRPQTVTEAAARTAEFLDVLGGGDPRARSVVDILAAQQEVVRRNAAALGPEPPFQLVADGDTVGDDLIAAAGGVPILVGITRDEAGAFHSGGDRGAELTESMFRRPAELIARQGNPAWGYQFDWCPAGSPFGACHCIELPFVFGNPSAWRDAPMLAGGVPEKLVDTVQTAWISFVRDGNPGWPVYPSVIRLSTLPTVQRGWS